MALAQDSELKVESLVLTKHQSQRLRAIRDSRKTVTNRVTLSDVAREVVEAGLESLSFDQDSEIFASDSKVLSA